MLATLVKTAKASRLLSLAAAAATVLFIAAAAQAAWCPFQERSSCSGGSCINPAASCGYNAETGNCGCAW